MINPPKQLSEQCDVQLEAILPNLCSDLFDIFHNMKRYCDNFKMKC